MKSTTKSVWQKLFSIGAALLLLGFASSCSKKLMPPEIESGGQSSVAESSGGGGGISESGFSESSGAGASGGGQEPGFNIQEQPESGPGGGFFVEENVGEKGGADMSAGSGGDLGGGSQGMPGTGSDGFFAAPGTENGGTGSGGLGSGSQEARLQNFQETGDLNDIHFAFDKYDLTDESKQILRQNAEWLKQNPGARVEIQGHCDERGTNNYNLGLGERRAVSTKKFLKALGIDEGRIFTISYGEEKPFCFESNEDCWWKNRRAHFMVAK